MIHYTKEELQEGIKAMESLIHKCEKAQLSIKSGTSSFTTLTKRLHSFKMAHTILVDQLEALKLEK